MKKSIVLVAIIAVALTGCQTTATPPTVTRAEILRGLDVGQTVFNVSLAYAELKGAEPAKVNQVRAIGNASFSIARNAVLVDGADLPAAVLHIRVAVDDALTLCEAVGVDAATVALLRGRIEQVWVLLDAAVAARG